MYSFIVLGQIPGTNITISFTMWLQLALMLAIAVALYKYTRKHKTISMSGAHPSGVMIIRNGRPVPANEITL